MSILTIEQVVEGLVKLPPAFRARVQRWFRKTFQRLYREKKQSAWATFRFSPARDLPGYPAGRAPGKRIGLGVEAMLGMWSTGFGSYDPESIVLRVNMERSFEGHDEEWWLQRIERIVDHELTHFVDHMFRFINSELYKISAFDLPGGYHKHRVETEAFVQTVVTFLQQQGITTSKEAVDYLRNRKPVPLEISVFLSNVHKDPQLARMVYSKVARAFQ